VTGVQTCALPIFRSAHSIRAGSFLMNITPSTDLQRPSFRMRTTKAGCPILAASLFLRHRGPQRQVFVVGVNKGGETAKFNETVFQSAVETQENLNLSDKRINPAPP